MIFFQFSSISTDRNNVQQFHKSTPKIEINNHSMHSLPSNDQSTVDKLDLYSYSEPSGDITLDQTLTIQSSGDITYHVGETGNTITWEMSEGGGEKNYQIYKDGIIIENGSWTPNSPISINVDGLSVGKYNYTIYATSGDLYGIDTVFVTVFQNLQFLETPTNNSYSFNTTGNYLQWTVSDDDPADFVIYRNQTNFFESGWISEYPIKINIDGLDIGVYNFTIVVSDTSGNVNQHSVFVTVSNFPNFISAPDQYSYEIGSVGNYLEWIVSDSNPHYYSIYNDTALIKEGTWSNEEPITVNIDDLDIGLYNFTLLVNDTDGNLNQETTKVYVGDLPTFHQFPENQTTIIEGSTDNILSWNISDMYPYDYVLYSNNTLVDSGNWTNYDPINYSIDHLELGFYNITLVVYDLTFLSNYSTIWIDVIDQTAPQVLSSPELLKYSYDEPSINLTWTVSEKHPAIYSTYINGTSSSSDSWLHLVIIDFPSREIGNYNFTVVFYDSSGNFIKETVILEIFDDIPPQKFSSPGNQTMNYDEQPSEMYWNFSDISPSHFYLYQNRSLQFTNTWSNQILIEIRIDSLLLGTYNFTIVAFDSSTNFIVDTIFITIDPIPTIKPELDLNESIFEGDKIRFDGYWIDYMDNGIPDSNIEIQLVRDQETIKSRQETTSPDGWFSILLNHSNLDEGQYRWELTFMKDNYQYWAVLLDIHVYWYTLTLSISMDQILVQGADLTVDLEASLIQDPSLFEVKSSKINKNNSNIKLYAKFSFTTLNGDIHEISDRDLTDQNGRATLTLEREHTGDIRGINSIVISLEEDTPLRWSGLAITEDLPKIEASGFSNWIQLELNISPNQFFLLLAVILILPSYFLFRKFQVTYVIFSRRKYLALYHEMNNIHSIFIRNESGMLFYEKQFTTSSRYDGTLIAGLSAAISSFLDEFITEKKKGFEVMEKEGLVITAYNAQSMTIVIVSEKNLDTSTMTKIKSISKLLEIKLKTRFESDYGNFNNTIIEQISRIFNRKGIPISLFEGKRIDPIMLNSLQNTKAFPEIFKEYLPIISKTVSKYGENRTYNIDFLLSILMNEEVSEKIAILFIFELYHFGVFSTEMEPPNS